MIDVTIFTHGSIMPKDFLTTAEWAGAELDELIESALRFKHGGDQSKPLAKRASANSD